jgi:hypothetical protein
MNMGRRILLVVLTPLFSLLLFALAFNFGLVKTIGDAHSVKNILKDSGIYNSVVPSLLKQAGQINTNAGDIPALDPLVQDAIAKSLPVKDVQGYSENAIDNIYSWLNGETAQPNFNIDLSNYKTSFASNLAKGVGQRLGSLPTCTTGHTATDFDAINATCLPPGVSAETASNTLEAELIKNQGFLDQTSVKASDIKGNDSTKSVFQDQLKDAPAAFQWFSKSPIILAVLALLTGIGLVLLRPTLINGIRHLGITLLAVGISMLAFAWIFNFVVSDKVIPKIAIENSTLQQSAKSAASNLSRNVGNNYYMFGGVYSVLGIASLAGSSFLSRKGRPEVIETTPQAQPGQPKEKLPKKS